MFKKSLLALALMSSALSASAAVQTFDWSYKGLIERNTFDPDLEVRGRFMVDDKNADGTFSRDEVLSFVHLGKEFILSYFNGVHEFSFTPGGTLNFHANVAWSNSQYNYGARIVTGESAGVSWFDSSSGSNGFSEYYWTNQTRLTVAAVPEPQTWLMLGAGLLLTAGATRRRRKQASR
jgi:hypothetical protein